MIFFIVSPRFCKIIICIKSFSNLNKNFNKCIIYDKNANNLFKKVKGEIYMNKPISNLLKGMAVGVALTTVAVVLTSKSATKKVKNIAETTMDNVSTMFKMN